MYLVTTCTKFHNITEPLRAIAEVHKSTYWLSTRWDPEAELKKYNVPSILAIYKEFEDDANAAARQTFNETEGMTLLKFHKLVRTSAKKQKVITGRG